MMLNLPVAWDAQRTPCCSGSRTMAQGSSDSTTWDFNAGSRGINGRLLCLPIAFEQKMTQKLIKCIFSYRKGTNIKSKNQNVAKTQRFMAVLVRASSFQPCGDGPLPHQLQGLCWPRRIGLCLIKMFVGTNTAAKTIIEKEQKQNNTKELNSEMPTQSVDTVHLFCYFK